MKRISLERLGESVFGLTVALLSGVIGANSAAALVASVGDTVPLQPLAGLVVGAGLAVMVAARTRLFNPGSGSLLLALGILSGGLFRLTEDDAGLTPSAGPALAAGVLAVLVGLAVLVVLSRAMAGSWQPAALVPRTLRQSLGASIGIVGIVVVSVVIAGSVPLTSVGWVGWVVLVGTAVLLGVSVLWTRRMGWSTWLVAASIVTLAGLVLFAGA